MSGVLVTPFCYRPSGARVIVQFYPWFNFYFPWFLTHYHTLP